MTEKARSLEMTSEEFKKAGYLMVDEIAKFLDEVSTLDVTTKDTPSALRKKLPDDKLPETGMDTNILLKDTTDLLVKNSLFNGHPRFWGYITSSAAPIGALADLLAASINPNVGAQALSPMATEIEKQTIQWLSELIGYRNNCGGIFVSGGNMANFVGYLAAKNYKVTELNNRVDNLVVYCPKATHTWVQKAKGLFGNDRDIIRWVSCSADGKMDVQELDKLIGEDINAGLNPFMVVANGGTVETGMVDDFTSVSEVCNKYKVWMHIDGAYGAPAAALAENKDMFKGLERADSVAIDPHKWLYSPLEAGCLLIRDGNLLKDTFSHSPQYYNFSGSGEDAPLNYHEYGLQNSRGFKALKVWMSLKQVGRSGLEAMIRKDIQLASRLYELIGEYKEIEPISTHLSITTFRYVPEGDPELHTLEYLNTLNQQLLEVLQNSGKVFLSPAVINNQYCLRVCIVNFRTQEADLKALLDIVKEEGEKLI